MFKTQVKRSEELYIQFSEEQIAELGLKTGEKLSCEAAEDGSIILKKYASLEVDISEWSREVLENLITDSIENDISVNEVIENILRKYLELEK